MQHTPSAPKANAYSSSKRRRHFIEFCISKLYFATQLQLCAIISVIIKNKFDSYRYKE